MFALAVAAAVAASQPAAAAVAAAAPAAAVDPAAVEIAELERKWGEAFVSRDFDFIDRIVAPEYRLVVAAPDGSYGLTPRDAWMKNARVFTHHAFAVETLDVNRAGDTAVASAHGLWTVSFAPGQPPTPVRFFVTDTWLRRNGRWQVIHRYSHRLPDAPWPPRKDAPAN